MREGSTPFRLRVPAWILACGFLVLLSAGLAWKTEAGTRGMEIETDDRNAVVSFLKANGYRQIEISKQGEAARVAGNGLFGCRMSVVRARREGWDQYAVQQAARKDDDFFFVFKGSTFDQYPGLTVRLTGFQDRLQRQFGKPPPERPLLAVSASRSCAGRDLPWSDLL